MTKDTVDSDSRRNPVKVGRVVLVSVPELMTSEVTITGLLGETVITGVAELVLSLDWWLLKMCCLIL